VNWKLNKSFQLFTGNPPILDTPFFLQNAQDINKYVILEFFHSQNIKNTLLHSQGGKIKEKAFLNVTVL